jgi:hypothetical protein
MDHFLPSNNHLIGAYSYKAKRSASRRGERLLTELQGEVVDSQVENSGLVGITAFFN